MKGQLHNGGTPFEVSVKPRLAQPIKRGLGGEDSAKSQCWLT